MLEKLLEILEDGTFTHSVNKNQHLEAILHALDKDNVGAPVVERILTVCVRDLKEDARHAVFCLNIISKIVNKHQSEVSSEKLVSTAESVLDFIVTAASLNKAESLQTFSFITLLAFPDNVLAELATRCDNVYELFNLYCHFKMPEEIRIKPINLVHRMIQNLSPDQRSTFVKKGLAVWFSRVVPTAMSYFQSQSIGTSPTLLVLMQLLETVTEEVVTVDYSSNLQWQTVLENIYSPQAYPQQMRNLLQSGSVLWHRIWIIFIKLLKTQITVNKPGVGSPINSMLPVVEMAFKMDIKNRCRAFQCWKVLIDNFSAETNELFVNKRIKLLIIPLRSNNAKVEETALAKLDTWWHLIKQYQSRVDERMLYPFLHFCFGRHIPEKTVLIPGMISPPVKKNCIEVFVEMAGHVNCEGCVSMPRLKNRLISSKVLVDHWSDWTHSLKMAIKVSAEDDVDIGKQPITCAWKSFVMTIAEMPESNIRNDLFNDLLTMTKLLAQESKNSNKLADIVNEVLISSLIEEKSLKKLLKSKEYQNGPIHVLLSILIDPTFADLCKEHTNQALLTNLKLITEFLVLKCHNLEEDAIKWLMQDVTPSDNSLLLWKVLAEALQVSPFKHDYLKQTCNLLLWPLLNLERFTNVEAAALTWNSTYCVMHLTTVQTVWFHMEISRILAENDRSSPTSTFFILCVLLAVIKTKIITRTFEGLYSEVKLLQDVICKYNDYNDIKLVFPVLIDTLDLLSTAVNKDCVVSDNVQDVFVIGRKALNILTKHFICDISTGEVLIVKVVGALENLFKTKRGNELKIILLDELLDCRSLFRSIPVPSNLDTVLKSIMTDEANNKSIREKVKAILEKSEEKGIDTPKTKTPKTKKLDESKSKEHDEGKTKKQDESNFTTPVTKKGSIKQKTSIVNTVVENGEEFAVIKSNWKFNPRKLTENQKEKLQRKREDIPALYQDLSQSQDEFKLKSWKTDSQDASTTNSTSASAPSNDNISTLKNLPGTDIVPKIIDNFRSDAAKGDKEKNENEVTDSPKANKVDQTKSSPSVKIPRMALKDRVFRNVRNLIEKSTVSKEGSQKLDVLNQTVNANTCSTPITKSKETKNVANSAPSKINADRPARVKRKPKKFDDSEVCLEKKMCNSDSQSLDKNDASEDVAYKGGNINEEVNIFLKVATVSVTNMEVDEKEMCISKAPNMETDASAVKKSATNDQKPSDNTHTVKTGNDKIVFENSSPSVEKNDDKVTGGDECFNVNRENGKCSENDLSVDKSIDETQQPKQRKDTSDSNTSTPKPIGKKKDSDVPKSTTKKKSSIEKQLAIDMVEGHPFLKLQTEKRVTRKALTESPTNARKMRLVEKLNKSKTDSKSAIKIKKGSSNSDLPKEKTRKNSKEMDKSSVTVCETQDISSDATQDLSEDVIESSQDTTTTISVKSLRTCTNKRSISAESLEKSAVETQDLVDKSSHETNTTADVINHDNKDDSELPANKTDVQENIVFDLTEEMDTEPASSGDVIIINDEEPEIDLNTNDCDPAPGPDTLELANADTQPTDPSQFLDNTNPLNATSQNDSPDTRDNEKVDSRIDESQLTNNAEDRTITLVDITLSEETAASSPTNDEDQRKKDFLNNTSEISPIKSLSPIEPHSPVSETSSDFLVIKLSGPVQMNGEPLEMSNSPEIFTEEKVSPDKRDQSPPRAEVAVTISSPSSSLSLKKNLPQVRSGGRAAQMLGLCVPDRLQTFKLVERPDTDEPKKSSPVNTPARRNLRILYQTAQSTDSDNSDEKEESENFLKFKKTLPTADCSPSGPILKRKLADIADETTVSPANKRKRVSFHDPVSTSVSVQKYIETGGVRSPQNSALKRLERQLRHQSPMKSPKRLDSLFKLDSILTKAIESFSEDVTPSNDTELSSLDQTPIVEVVKTSELNDTDPIFPDLIDCKDSIDTVASELSSPGMKLLLVKELEGKIETIGDLAKLTELEVNRICIKAPKVQVAKKVLADYASRKEKATAVVSDITMTELEINEIEKPEEQVTKTVVYDSLSKTAKIVEEVVLVTPRVDVNLTVATSVGVQTNILMSETETQTSLVLQRLSSTQTDEFMTAQKSSQTDESGNESTKDIITKCLKDRPDFVQKLADTLPVKDCTDLLVTKMTSDNAKGIFNSVLQRECELHTNGLTGNKELSFLQNYLCDKYDVKDLILFCSQMMQKMYDKSNGDENV